MRGRGRRNRKNHEFLSGVLTGGAVVVMVLAIVLDVAIWNYGDTVESIFVLAKNAVVSSVKKGEKEEFSSTEVAAKLDMLHAYIEEYYLRDSDADAEQEAVYKAVIAALDDPYSVYYTPEEYQSMNEKFEGSYVGIGVTAAYNKETGEISVEDVTKGSGADDAGLKKGDVFFSIEGESVENMELSELAEKLRGEEGSSVLISVKRKGQKKELEFTVERREVSLQTVSFEMLEDKVGYVAVSSFSQNTPDQFDEAINELLSEGMEGMVIDLRNNGGGSFSASVDMLDRLLPKGLLVYTRTKDGKEKKYYSTDEESFDQPFAVLINENSASASEIFAGAVKDREAGTLVGTTSFGKGIVQKTYVLDDGSAVKLTNSEYFTPNGNNIHGIGIEPDVEVEAGEGEEDLQLEKAVEIVRNAL
jgi:carboxyl-terminal processing protease